MRPNLAAIAVSGMLMSVHYAARAGETLADRMQACAAELDDAKRLDCYDREIGREKPGESGNLGVTGELLWQERRQAGLKPPIPRNITGQVRAIARSRDGKFTVTLDNGQVWSQQEVLDFPLQVGDVVSVRRGALGVLWMTNGTQPIETRVHRVN